MPAAREPIVPLPKYRLHKPTGLGVVTLNGRDFYLGRYGTPESLEAYNRRIAEWQADGRQLLPPPADATVAARLSRPDLASSRAPKNPFGALARAGSGVVGDRARQAPKCRRRKCLI